MRTLRVTQRLYLVFAGGLFLVVGMAFLYGLATDWTVSSMVEAVLGVVLLLVAFVAIIIGHHLLFRSPYELRVDRDNLVHFITLTGSHSVLAPDIESIHYGVGFRVAGRWLGSLEGTTGLTVVHRNGVVAVPCSDPLRVAGFLTGLNPDIHVDDQGAAAQSTPSGLTSAQEADALPGDAHVSRPSHSIWMAGFIALPCIIGAAVVYGIDHLLTYQYWSLLGRLSVEDFRSAWLVIWVVLSVMLIPFVLALGWAIIEVLKVATARRYRHARRRKVT